MHIANKFIVSLTNVIATIFCLALLHCTTLSFSNTPESYKLKKVVLDAGHGGKDPGAIGIKGKEKDIVLSVTLKLGKYIEQAYPEIEVLYTRKEDVFVGVAERSVFANEKGADLFISIHCNANPSKYPFGAETYVMGLHKSNENLDVAMRENAVITYEEDYSKKYEGYDPNSAESFIIFSLMQHSFLDQSLIFASNIQTEFKEKALRKDRGVKQAGFLVLWRTTMPSVLVELGFLSHPREEEFLLSEQGQDYLASALYRAFKEHKANVEARSTLIAERPTSTPKLKPEAKESNVVSVNPTNPGSTSTGSNLPNSVEEKAPAISTNSTLALNNTSKVAFKVQITSSTNPIPRNSGFFKKVDGIEEFSVDGIFKYYIGMKQNYSDIVDYCSQVKELFPDAFIVAFQNGKQIPMDQAIKLSTQ